MSTLITSCPSCGVRFKLVPDQLKVSDGWVRCGQCREIFDASTRIEQPATSVIQQVPLLTEEWTPKDSTNTPEQATPLPAPTPVAEPVPASSPAASPEPEPTPAPTASLAAESAPIADPVPESEPQTTTQAIDIDIVVDEPLAQTPRTGIGFIQDAQRQARWNRPGVRLSLGLVALCLLLSLIAQLIYTERNRIAALYPQSAGWVTSLCNILQCDVQPYQDLDAVVIEGTKFQKLSNDATLEAFELDLVLKSKAAYPVAWPALELSLTNSQDQVVLRKVLLPQQYAQSDVFAAQSERNIRTAIQIQAHALPSKISGYRVLLFYP
jgi:predicted Zn finger-like uncharacterized protein